MIGFSYMLMPYGYGFPGEDPGLVMLILHLCLPLVASLAFFPSIVAESHTRLKLIAITVTIKIIDIAISVKIIILTITIVISTNTIALASARDRITLESKDHLE